MQVLPTTVRRRSGARAVEVVALVAVLAGCALLPGPPVDPPPGAEVSLSLAIPSSSSSAPCTGQIRWTLTPQQVDGSHGQRTQWSSSEQLTAAPGLDPDQPGSYACEFVTSPSAQFGVGTWTFEVSAGPYFGRCPVTLRDGLNSVSYRVRSGCRT